jgi:hypothetical protein
LEENLEEVGLEAPYLLKMKPISLLSSLEIAKEESSK